ncbi:MAG TPA: ribosome rescue GTPase HflX [Gammaproteobacteria bacterium]|nr:ribosome rescue GTPase HflX [Gammaproteobacteria bacterium]
MLERPRSLERSLLVHIGFGRACYEDEIQEFEALAESAGAKVVGSLHAQRAKPDVRFFLGTGKTDELAAMAAETCADLVLVNRSLTPSQERNLERRLHARVLDRNALILDIFAQRAASFEGKLQVELAQLEHLSTRLVRGWTHLERQKGGIGLRGPGETQLETDRRLLARRIRHLKERLERVERQRQTGRKERMRSDVPLVALVGYTNAGKTTLFNALSGARLEARDQLFATLDPTVRRLDLPGGDQALLVDTVGFVRDLPHELVAAFRATLTETREASLLLHVIDASDPHHADRTEQVESVLEQIGAGEVPRLEVYNKIDRVCDAVDAGLRKETGKISVSAVTGEGLERLLEAIRSATLGDRVAGRLRLGPEHSRARAKLFDWRAVRGETPDPAGGWTLDVELTARRWRELARHEGLPQDALTQAV